MFVLRYRIFDVFSKSHPGDGKIPINAERIGGPFRIYASKDFPGLLESTELTKVRLFAARQALDVLIIVPDRHSLDGVCG